MVFSFEFALSAYGLTGKMSACTARSTRNSRGRRFLPLETFGLALHTPKKVWFRGKKMPPKGNPTTEKPNSDLVSDSHLDKHLSDDSECERQGGLYQQEGRKGGVNKAQQDKLTFGFDEKLSSPEPSPKSSTSSLSNPKDGYRENSQTSQTVNQTNTSGSASVSSPPTLPPSSVQEPSLSQPEGDGEVMIRKELIDKKDRGDTGAISDALNQMYIFMQENKIAFDSYVRQTEDRFLKINENVSALSERVGSLESGFQDQKKTMVSLNEEKVSKDDIKVLEEEMVSIKSSCQSALERAEALSSGQNELIERQEQEIANLRLNQSRLKYQQHLTTERLNVYDIRSKHLSITIDGLPEALDKSVIDSVIDRVHLDTEAKLVKEDFQLAYRVGKPVIEPEGGVDEGANGGETPHKRPRQIRAKLSNDKAKEKIMNARGKLKKNNDKSSVWINESLPEEYRRRKIMLKELVKFINKKPNDYAAIESGGLRLNDQFIEPSQLDDLPDEFHPSNVQILNVGEGGLAFAGEWAYLSNMYRCPVYYMDLDFTSSEQAYQFSKADFHGCAKKAVKILHLEDPFDIKKVGNSIIDSQDWLDNRDTIIEEIIREKFVQNPTIRERLQLTGDKEIYEATLGPHWGINAGLRSKTTRTCTGNGENAIGKILMNIRSEFRPADTRKSG